MKLLKTASSLVTIGAIISASVTSVHALPADSLYTITINQHGSFIPFYQAKSAVDFKSSYADLSDEQKNTVRNKFDNLGITDTPPYPSNGSGDLYRPLLEIGAQRGYKGKLIMNATIDLDGKVSATEVIESPNKYFSQKAIKIVNNTKFDAGFCGQAKCVMSYPIEIRFN